VNYINQNGPRIRVFKAFSLTYRDKAIDSWIMKRENGTISSCKGLRKMRQIDPLKRLYLIFQ